jgi:hypothetical protein
MDSILRGLISCSLLRIFFIVVVIREDLAVCEASNTIYSKRIGRESKEKERDTHREKVVVLEVFGSLEEEEEMCDEWVGAFAGEYDLLVFLTMNC